MTNETIDWVVISVETFEHENACQATLPSWIANMSFNASNPQIGNESYTAWIGSSTYIYLIFREGRVAVWFTIGMHNPTDWLYDTAISIVQLQLEKIDKYLA